MNEPMDWEKAMRDSQASSKAAAKHSERIVNAMSELLTLNRHLSSEIAGLRKRMDARPMDARPAQEPTKIPEVNQPLQNAKHLALQTTMVIAMAAFAVGAVSGAYFLS